jgi:hypothetical protein
MNLYADEDLDRQLVDRLRESHDILFVTEDANRRQKSDAWHLGQAADASRVLLTFNEHDYRFLHRVWTTSWVIGATTRRHAGIISVTRRVTPEGWIDPLLRLFDSTDDFRGRMMVWHHVGLKWDEDAWRPND